MRVLPALLGAVLLTVPLVACSSGGAGTNDTNDPAGGVPPTTAGPGTAAAPTSLTAADWPTYHHDNTRTGVATGPTRHGGVRAGWRADLDGAVYGQPLVIGDRILAATENDTVYALAADTGKVLWSTHLDAPERSSNLPCGNIDPLGITSTMAFDPATSRVFALAETTGGAHTLAGIDVRTGAVQVRVPAEPPLGDRIAHQQRSALTVLGNRVYIAYGGLAGDCANYIGSVVSLTTAGTDPLTFHVPTGREGGIWTPGGAVVSGGNLLYSVGNGESTNGAYDGSDSVIALTPELRQVDSFAPSSWADDNDNDLDLGSSNPTLLGPWVFIAGKRGTGYVLRPNHLGGVGGQVSTVDACQSYGGGVTNGAVAYLPCMDSGPIAVSVNAAGRARVLWRSPVKAAGAPSFGGGALWVIDYEGGVLYALDPATGAQRSRTDIGAVPHFASPTLAGGAVFVGTMHGVLRVDFG